LTSSCDRNFTEQDRHIVTRRRFGLRNNLKCDGQQRVPGEHRNPIAKDFVTRGTPAAEIIVIHAREVIMHERIRVDAFERAGQGESILGLAMASFRCRETKDRPQSLASGEKTVAHRLVKRRRFDSRFRQIAVQGAVDLFLMGPQIGFQIHFMSANRIDAICSMLSEAEKAATDFPPIRLLLPA
jgi:hypothetical protein